MHYLNQPITLPNRTLHAVEHILTRFERKNFHVHGDCFSVNAFWVHFKMKLIAATIGPKTSCWIQNITCVWHSQFNLLNSLATMTMTNTNLNNATGATPGPDAHLQGSNNPIPGAPRRPVYTANERMARRAAMQAERARDEGFNVDALPVLHLGNPHRALNF